MSAAFMDRLAEAIRSKGNPVMVGLDPRLEWLPSEITENARKDLLSFSGSFAQMMGSDDDKVSVDSDELDAAPAAFEDFCCALIDIVAPLVPCVKPQAAFFEQLGSSGMVVLESVISYAREQGLLVILDGKRNDIGTTAAAYAKGILGDNSAWQADALTVSPYLGDDSLEPFIQTAVERDAGIFVLVKTSNPGGKMIQDLEVEGRKIYEIVGDFVQQKALESQSDCGYGAVGAVVGATYPKQLAELRQRMPNTFFLIPGFGAQGGTAADVLPAFDENGLGAVVNNSRGINFAWRSKKYESFGEARWKDAVKQATIDMCAVLGRK